MLKDWLERRVCYAIAEGGAAGAGGSGEGAGAGAGTGAGEGGGDGAGAGAGAGAGQGAGGGAGEGAGAAPSDLMALLSPDSRAALEPKGYKSPDDLAKAYLSLESKIGAKGVIPPGDKATPEEIRAFYSNLPEHLRPPEKPDGYSIDTVEAPEGFQWFDEVRNGMLQAFHDEGLNDGQATRLLGKYAALQHAFDTAKAESDSQFTGNAKAELQREWGGAFGAKVAQATNVLRLGGGKDTDAMLELKLADGGFLLDHPQVVRALANIGQHFGEDLTKLVTDAGRFALTPAEAAAEVTKLKAEPEFQKAFLNGNHPEHPEAVERMQRLKALAASASQ